VKKGPVTSHIPVIMISAYPRLLKSLGHYRWDDFIAKPFEIDEFYRVIRKHLLQAAS